jgi:hypothetical protein
MQENVVYIRLKVIKLFLELCASGSYVHQAKIQGKTAYIRHKVVELFPVPYASESCVYRAALFLSVLNNRKEHIKVGAFIIQNYFIFLALFFIFLFVVHLISSLVLECEYTIGLHFHHSLS